MISPPSLSRIARFGLPNGKRPLRWSHGRIEKIRTVGQGLSSLHDDDLAQRMADLRIRAVEGTPVTNQAIIVPAYALVVEAARRVLGITLYDVQLLAGLVLAGRSIAEMQTGEGKTFVAMLPAALHALRGEGVHVMTVNSYLAARDFESLAPVYRILGLSVGLIDSDVDAVAKRAAYACDITYGPGYEFGFDYLRDQVALVSHPKPRLGEAYRTRQRGGVIDRPKQMQRGHAVAIVDEADSVFLDEATTPLLLSAEGNRPAENSHVYQAAARVAKELAEGQHYLIDPTGTSLQLTEAGLKQLSKPVGRIVNPSLSATDGLPIRPTSSSCVPACGLERPWPTYVEQALRAELLYHRDVHYVVEDGEIRLVDQHTGRIFKDRTWRDGLQQAVQEKEGVTITTETSSLARITRQRYFGLYKHLCGMTGTATGSQRELRRVYGLGVVVVPLNKPCHRRSLPMRVFGDTASKEAAIAKDVERIHATGQPILIGTESIEGSERLACLLVERNIAFQLLNGKQDAEEAEIVARAGQMGTVTIATNLAGRGTDIKLGAGVAELGGLHVVAAVAQESARVDRQLVGRAARQGEPGSSQVFISAEDRLIQRHAPSLAHRIRRQADASGEVQVELSAKIAAVQRRVERQKAKQRQQMFAHDDWLESILEKLTGTG